MALAARASDVTDDTGHEFAHEHHRLRRLVTMTIVALLTLGLVRVLVFEPYAIPTGSMKPTIIEGDVLLVNKLHYAGFGELERGDVVVFEYPGQDNVEGEDDEFVKRVAAVPGDSVQIISGRVFVNGSEVSPSGPGNHWGERRVAMDQRRAIELLRFGGRVVVPYEGYTIQLDSVAAARWRRLIESEGTIVEYNNRIVFINGSPATFYRFKRNYFFALGDNSADSHDSRFFGFVPFDNLIGKALLIYWSRNDRDGMRWDRMGTFVD